MTRNGVAMFALALLFGTAGMAMAGGDAPSGNRAIIKEFVDRFYTQKDVPAAFGRFVAPDYIQHNPGVPDGAQAALDALTPMFAQPGAQFDVRHVMVDGDLALVHLLGRGDSKTPGAAVVDIYRLKDSRVVEHWDVIQPIEPGTDPIAVTQAGPAQPGDTARNRIIAQRFADLFQRKQFAAAFKRYVAADMIQHNERLGKGRDGSIAALTALFGNPGSSIDIKRILVDGNMVAIHYRGKLSADNDGAAVVELFRLSRGKMVEHWGVFQPMPTKARNAHPMF